MNLPRTRPLLLALAGLAFAACDGGSGPDQAGPPARLDIVSGDLQTAVVGAQLPQALVVEVMDDKGKPVEGQVVNFVVTAGGGTVFAGTALTNAEGRAQERWTLGTTARDTQRVEARAVNPSTGQALVFAAFRAVGTPGAPAALVRVGGDAQTGAPGVALADSLAVRLTDAHGNGISGQSVAFAAAGGGSVSPATRTTDADGVARAAWTLGTNVSLAQTVTVQVEGRPPATFTATSTGSGMLTRTGGNAQADSIGAFLADSLQVTFTTAAGLPIQGATIEWAASGLDGSVSPQTSTTGADGTARTRWRLGTTSGNQLATARVAGQNGVLPFSATARPGAPDTMDVVSVTPEAAPLGTVRTVRVVVHDRALNRVPAATVQWSIVCGGPVSPAASQTDASGFATTQWTVNNACSSSPSGPNGSATVAGAGTVQFAALVSGATPARVEIVPDSVTVPLNGSLRLEHRLYDAFGNYIQPYEDCRYTCYHGFTWTFTNTSVATFGGYVDEDVQSPINVNLVGEGTTLVIVSKGSLADTAVVTVTGASGAASRSPAPLRRAAPGPRAPAPAASPHRPRGRED